jgi:hypothetical protein
MFCVFLWKICFNYYLIHDTDMNAYFLVDTVMRHNGLQVCPEGGAATMIECDIIKIIILYTILIRSCKITIHIFHP